MDNVIRPIFGAPRRTEQHNAKRVQLLTQRAYGEVNGCRDRFIQDGANPKATYGQDRKYQIPRRTFE